ncbi:M23 family metallopeptidase [Pseudomethylobacillus aquaticus]|uniref:M23 family metallopeptidase n=1 Tax=Pseudomethylobacillus aquaticus TaxID=2676064 RepID=A0A3N0V267_9PROT|nr:M23 family metallopeptidase [Pseudomethylobacillus aquaticus]ROH86813.1 M23 family metallopeptidase [Pseudomethylobacillus aquaticus]
MQKREPEYQQNILAQNLTHKERKLRLRWLIVISALPLFGIYAAFGIAPQTITQDIVTQTITEEVPLPVSEAVAFNESSYWQTEVVRRDDTLDSLIDRLNIKNTEAIAFLKYNNEASLIAAHLRPGRIIRSETNAAGVLSRLEYQVTPEQTLTIEAADNGYRLVKDSPDVVMRSVFKAATINSSLFGATDAAEIPDQVAIQLAEIFSGDIDFHSDLRKGDRLVVVYEVGYSHGEPVRSGKVLAAEFVNNGKSYRAVLFRHPDGHSNYYTPEGKSLHKSFLRSPLEFTRISSGFSLGRFHPILQRMRAHKGVDYAAPTGTRVKAAADGTVDFVGVKGGYGNVVILRHDNGMKTVYGHLSKFSQGLRSGKKVSQSDIIGYVGMSGMATGPHLHYELLLNNQHRDPLRVALPTAVPIPAKYRQEFNLASSNLVAQLELLSRRQVAVLE